MGGRILLGLIVIALGIAVGWYMFGGKFNVKQLPNPFVTTNTSHTTTPGIQSGTPEFPTPTTSYTYAEVPTTGMPTPTGSVVTKGGVVVKNQTPVHADIKYTDSGFSPMVITVTQGSAVTFTNNTAKTNMWVQSNTQKGGLAGFDQLKSVPSGGTYTYTFTKVGTWKYDNHALTTHTGTVIVTQ
jgi:plastocyanin